MKMDEHLHGGDPTPFFRRFGISRRDVEDFSVNVNPLGPPPALRSLADGFLEYASSYPSLHGEGVKAFYETRFGIPPGRVVPSNGSVEAIYHVLRVFSPRRVCVILPSFHDYVRASRIAGAAVEYLPLPRAKGFAPPSFDAVKRVFRDVDALILGNPNNPTGTLFSREMLLDLARAFPGKLLLVDEAFVQFLADWESVSFLCVRDVPSNVVVFHSLTKFYALPGLRLGAAVASEEVAARLRSSLPPWHVNALADAAARLLVECTPYEADTRHLVVKERERMRRVLASIRRIEVFPSAANFLLAEVFPSGGLDDLLPFLLEKGLFVRDCRNFEGLEGGDFFRFCVKEPSANDRLLGALLEWCGE